MWFLTIFKLFNFKQIIPSIIKNWKQITIIGLLVTVIYQNLFETRWILWVNTIPYLESQLVVKEKELQLVVTANKQLSAAIDSSNKQIEQWKQVSNKLEEDNQQLSNTLNGLRVKTNNTVNNTLNEPTPQTCEKAIDFLRISIGELRYLNEENIK